MGPINFCLGELLCIRIALRSELRNISDFVFYQPSINISREVGISVQMDGLKLQKRAPAI